MSLKMSCLHRIYKEKIFDHYSIWMVEDFLIRNYYDFTKITFFKLENLLFKNNNQKKTRKGKITLFDEISHSRKKTNR